MSKIFIDWSQAPEETTHIDLVTGNWEQHNSERVYRWIENGRYWAKVFDGRFAKDTMRKRRVKPANVATEPEVEEIVLQAIPEPLMSVEGYEKLADVLLRAYDQASAGKGKDRHANDLPFHLQPMQQICDQVGVGFAMGQAIKKAQESLGLPRDRAIAEVLGAINYLAGVVIFMEKQPRLEQATVNVVNPSVTIDQAKLKRAIAELEKMGLRRPNGDL
jgi:hypothetical protein